MCMKERAAHIGAREVQAEPRAEERRMPSPVPRMDVTMNCEPALAVMSASFSRLAQELWMAAREALADRKQTFLPAVCV